MPGSIINKIRMSVKLFCPFPNYIQHFLRAFFECQVLKHICSWFELPAADPGPKDLEGFGEDPSFRKSHPTSFIKIWHRCRIYVLLFPVEAIGIEPFSLVPGQDRSI